MIKKILSILCMALCICLSVSANVTKEVFLDKNDHKSQSVEFPYARVTFEVLNISADKAEIGVSIENYSPDKAILLFRNDMDEKSLKQHSPKCTFYKTFAGSKGNRTVSGFGQLSSGFMSIIPGETETICRLDVKVKSQNNLEIPLYIADYNEKKLIKKGKYDVNYTLMEEYVENFSISLKIWTKSDPTYVAKAQEVQAFKESLKDVYFCKHKNHKPKLPAQKRSYEATRDSLINVINRINQDAEWMSMDEPYKEYQALIKQLQEIDLDSHIKLCSKHEGGTGGGDKGKGGRRGGDNVHETCRYASLSSGDIVHQLDDLAQMVMGNRISRAEAVKRATPLYNCYNKHKHPNREKSSFYTNKINRFYNRIAK